MKKAVGFAIAAGLALTSVAASAMWGDPYPDRARRSATIYTDGGSSVEGEEIQYCDGTYARWGQITMYSEYQTYDCPEG